MKWNKPIKENSSLTLCDILRVFWRWQLSCEMSNSYERMQAVAFCFSMAPALKKIYPDKESFARSLERHSSFFNTEGNLGAVILGMSVALEEEVARGNSPMGGEAISSFKTAAMGPVAGLGDTLTWGTLKPTIFALAVLAALGGSVAGWSLIFLFALITGIYSWKAMFLGYREGRNALSQLMNSDLIQRVISGAGIFGLFILGALAANSVEIGFTGKAAAMDTLVPGFLPLLLIFALCFYLRKGGAGKRFTRVYLALLLFSVALALIGVF